MMTEPVEFADEWISAWNTRDVEAVLVHYADDVLFTSPTAARVVPPHHRHRCGDRGRIGR